MKWRKSITIHFYTRPMQSQKYNIHYSVNVSYQEEQLRFQKIHQMSLLLLQKSENIIKSMDYKVLKYTPTHHAALTKLLHDAFSIQNNDREALVQWKFYDGYHHNGTISYLALDK